MQQYFKKLFTPALSQSYGTIEIRTIQNKTCHSHYLPTIDDTLELVKKACQQSVNGAQGGGPAMSPRHFICE